MTKIRIGISFSYPSSSELSRFTSELLKEGLVVGSVPWKQLTCDVSSLILRLLGWWHCWRSFFSCIWYKLVQVMLVRVERERERDAEEWTNPETEFEVQRGFLLEVTAPAGGLQMPLAALLSFLSILHWCMLCLLMQHHLQIRINHMNSPEFFKDDFTNPIECKSYKHNKQGSRTIF